MGLIHTERKLMEALKAREWKTRGDPAFEEEMEHAERQTHQGVHDKI